MAGVPRLLFLSPNGPEFEFDGKSASAADLSQICCDIFHRAKRLLDEDLLRGLTNEDFGITQDVGEIVDNPREEKPGYGFLKSSKLRKGMQVLKTFMDHPKTSGYFQYRNGSTVVLEPVHCRQFLLHAKKFKEFIYLLIHVLAGMPMRGSHERRLKIFNFRQRMRNIFRMLQRLAVVGNYSKTSALQEADRATLHFIPRCVENLLLRFFGLAADVENHFVRSFCPARKENYESYLFSSFGQRWMKEQLTTILRRETKFGMAQLRHILPGIQQHYGLHTLVDKSEFLSHRQQGHSNELGPRLYTRTHDSHKQLTNSIVYNTLRICDQWVGLLGFASDPPRPMSGDDMLAFARGSTYEREGQLTTATRELVELLTGSLEGIDGSDTHQRLARLKLALTASQLEPPALAALSSSAQTAPASSTLPESARQFSEFRESVERGGSSCEPDHIESMPAASPQRRIDFGDMEVEVEFNPPGVNAYNGEGSSQVSSHRIGFGKREGMARYPVRKFGSDVT
jgi:hypothetical protein